jgi:hypothetical protein
MFGLKLINISEDLIGISVISRGISVIRGTDILVWMIVNVDVWMIFMLLINMPILGPKVLKNTIGNSDIHDVFNKNFVYLMMVTVHCIDN